METQKYGVGDNVFSYDATLNISFGVIIGVFSLGGDSVLYTIKSLKNNEYITASDKAIFKDIDDIMLALRKDVEKLMLAIY